jgi:Asp-tRNA(Asn)/Glu-tRNA(Gln) amidotransferase A subunit family amidase
MLQAVTVGPDWSIIMDAESLSFLSLTELAAQLRNRKLSSAEVTRCILDRIRAANPRLHAYLTVMEESALRSAAQADTEIGAGRWRGPLHGVRQPRAP